MANTVSIPPAHVLVDLRLRCRLNTTAWLFRRYAEVQYQLDSALMMFNRDEVDPAFEDAVGILVDGTVYVDDEPCWRNLLKSRGTYAIVYLRRPIWQPGLLVWLCDLWNQTPLIDAQDVPKRRRKYTTEQAYTKLVKRATMVATEPRPCVHSRGSYWIWNKRGESEITDAEKLGRSVVYERMRLFNPAPEKEATIALARTC